MTAPAHTDADFQEVAVNALDHAVAELYRDQTVRDLFGKYGITPPPDTDSPRLCFEDSESKQRRHDALRLGALSRQLSPSALRTVLNGYREPNTITLAASPIGRAATAMTDGTPMMEQNYMLLPSQVHGSGGWPGIYEEMYRTDTGIFKHCNDHGTLFQETVYEPNMPEGERKNEQLLEIVKATDAAIKRCERRDKVRANAATLIRHGHAYFEPCWDKDSKGRWLPWKMQYIEQSAGHRLVFDERGNEFIGADFRAFTDRAVDAPNEWHLPRGDTPDTAKLIIFNYNATGNNLLGVPPTRPAVGLRKLKELVLEIQGIGFQRFGVPILMIFHQLAGNIAAQAEQLANPTHKAELQKLATRLEGGRARQGRAAYAPSGVDVKSISPQGEMPDAVGFLQYLDYAIALCFSNEGAMLGTGSGSYALAGMKENAFLRSAPAYTRCYVQGLDELLRWSVMFNYPGWEDLDELPFYSSRLPGSQDASRWTNDMSILMNAQVGKWPQTARRMAATNMGLSADTFDQFDVAPSPDISGQQDITPGAADE